MSPNDINKILLKRNYGSGNIPSISSLDLGELGVNTADGKLFVTCSLSGLSSVKTFLNSEHNPFVVNKELSAVNTQFGGNTVTEVFGSALGGYNNDISGGGSTVINGEDNDIDSDFSLIGSGLKNKILNNGDYSFIAAGSGNSINHQNVFILGTDITSNSPNFTYVNNISAQGSFYGNAITSNNVTVSNTISAKYLKATVLDWMTLVRGYKVVPTLNVSLPSGDVYNYVFSTNGVDVTYYRYIENDCDGEDSFYGNFSGGVLSNLIATKKITL